MKHILAKRLELGLTQAQFWGAVSVSQTCGSRYESGRPVPQPILVLLDLVYMADKVEADRMLRIMRKGR